jgi:glutathione S-transferase
VAIILYDLAGRDDRRFSPHCWRSRMALAHKGLDYEARPTRFTEIAFIGDGTCRTVPVIHDGARQVVDSWEIARYLEATHPDRPSLFGGSGGEAVTRFVQNWCVSTLHAGLVPLIVLDIWLHLAPEDQPYFRTTREQRFGRKLEEVQAGRDARLESFRASLAPVRRALLETPFLGGDGPLYADYLVFGAFQWARSISPYRVLEDDDPLRGWFERCLDLHGGLGRKAPGYT